MRHRFSFAVLILLAGAAMAIAADAPQFTLRGDRFKPLTWETMTPEQRTMAEHVLAGKRSSTPVVVFAHIPLWSLYPDWGWGTDDSAQALSYLKRFGSVSVLNGHIHQVMQKVEGHVTFHTAMSTAFPQPAPGSAPSPGPMKVEADRLKKVLGLSRMSFQSVNHPIAITDVPLEETMKAAADQLVVG